MGASIAEIATTQVGYGLWEARVQTPKGEFWAGGLTEHAAVERVKLKARREGVRAVDKREPRTQETAAVLTGLMREAMNGAAARVVFERRLNDEERAALRKFVKLVEQERQLWTGESD